MSSKGIKRDPNWGLYSPRSINRLSASASASVGRNSECCRPSARQRHDQPVARCRIVTRGPRSCCFAMLRTVPVRCPDQRKLVHGNRTAVRRGHKIEFRDARSCRYQVVLRVSEPGFSRVGRTGCSRRSGGSWTRQARRRPPADDPETSSARGDRQEGHDSQEGPAPESAPQPAPCSLAWRTLWTSCRQAWRGSGPVMVTRASTAGRSCAAGRRAAAGLRVEQLISAVSP